LIPGWKAKQAATGALLGASQMKLSKLSFIAKLFVCGLLLCGEIARAQTPDRIQAFDCQITVDRDRTMHVAERFEIVNGNGVFDSGFHRRLWIKPVNPQRVKLGSFQSVGAKVDGQDAVVRTSQDGNVLDLEVATETGTLSRGNHVIELSYLAKHQFSIYDNFEDLNQNISGEWPVSIEQVTVDLNLPEGIPKETGISADTGTDSHVQFDCLRTDLPSGVRFETTHSLSPGNRFFISARFPHPGYFVSNFREDGYRAVLQNHPLLLPGFVSLCGSMVFAAIGFMVWRRARESLVATSAVSSETSPSPSLWREVMRVYGFPMVMFALAIVPGLNFTYSGHGGPSWFFVPLCFPCVIVRILIKIAKGSGVSSRWYKSFFKITVPSYVAIALPLSWAAATSIRMTFGLPISTWTFFAIMVSPFPWWYFT
jgi:hypothetical protein